VTKSAIDSIQWGRFAYLASACSANRLWADPTAIRTHVFLACVTLHKRRLVRSNWVHQVQFGDGFGGLDFLMGKCDDILRSSNKLVIHTARRIAEVTVAIVGAAAKVFGIPNSFVVWMSMFIQCEFDGIMVIGLGTGLRTDLGKLQEMLGQVEHR